MSSTIATHDLSSFILNGRVRYPFEASAFVEAGVIHATDQESVLRSSAYIARSHRVRSWPGDPAPTKNYLGHKADLAYHTVLLPEGASERFTDAETLWNEIEATNVTRDRRSGKIRFKKRSRTAETLIADLPVCAAMTEAQQIELALSFARAQFVAHGAAVELAVHRYRDPIPRSKIERADKRGQATWTHSYMRRFNPPIYAIPSRDALPQTPPTTGPHALRFVENDAEFIVPYGPHAHILRTLQPIRGDKIGRKTELRQLDPPFASTRRKKFENGVRHWRGINTLGEEPVLFRAWRVHQERYYDDHGLAVSVMPPLDIMRRRTKRRTTIGSERAVDPRAFAEIVERCDGAVDLHSLSALAAAAGFAGDMRTVVERLANDSRVIVLGSGLFLSASAPGPAERAAKAVSKAAQLYLETHGRAARPAPWPAFEKAVATAEAGSEEPWPEDLLNACLRKSAQTEARVRASDAPREVRRHADLSLTLLEVVRRTRSTDNELQSTADHPPPAEINKPSPRAQSDAQGLAAGGTDFECAVAREMRRSQSGFDSSDVEPSPIKEPKRNEILVLINGREERRWIDDPIFRACSNMELAAMLQHARREAENDPFRGRTHDRAYRALRRYALMRGMDPENPSRVRIDRELYDTGLGNRFIDFVRMRMQGGLPSGHLTHDARGRGRARSIER
ncbi:MAG: MobA/MobL family protein [Marivibrio sp.]|uniref:MobA/MobL family protein n=1 Tax=Marivibrio sp. TaxID=2039719 RepID=UPI0032EDCC6D